MKIVAIAGGEIGTDDKVPYNLREIDEEIVKLTNKSHPILLFIGFNERANYFFGTLKKNYMELGVQCTYLKYTELENEKTVQSKFKRADILYFNGGNTIEYMKKVKKYNLKKYVAEALERGAVGAGKSAGAILFHKFGSSDSRTYKNSDSKFTKVHGMGFVDGIFVPHFSSSKRGEDLPRFLNGSKEVALCLDNCTALLIDGENYKIVKSDKNARAYKAFVANKKFEIFEILSNGKLEDLLKK